MALACPDNKNLKMRRELALAHRLLSDFNLSEGCCNHLTAMAPAIKGGGEEVMLLAPGFDGKGAGLDWSMVTASSLLGLNRAGEVVEGEGEPEITGASIHIGLRKHRPNARVIMHTHTPYATALSCLEDPTLLMVHQNSCRFLGRVAYDDGYAGFALEEEEGQRLGAVLEHKSVLMMGHHGTIIVADSVPIAFDELYYLERACMVQILAMAASSDRNALKIIPKEIQDLTLAASLDSLEKYANRHFFSLWNKWREAGSNVFH